MTHLNAWMRLWAAFSLVWASVVGPISFFVVSNRATAETPADFFPFIAVALIGPPLVLLVLGYLAAWVYRRFVS